MGESKKFSKLLGKDINPKDLGIPESLWNSKDGLPLFTNNGKINHKSITNQIRSTILIFILSNPTRRTIYQYFLMNPNLEISITNLLKNLNEGRIEKAKIELRSFRHHLKVMEEAKLITMQKKMNEKGKPVLIAKTKNLSPIKFIYNSKKVNIFS